MVYLCPTELFLVSTFHHRYLPYFKILLILHEGVTFGCTTFVNLGNKLAAEAAARPKLTAHVRYVWLHALQPFMMQILWPMALNRHQFALCLFNTPNL